jgi:hypothetical protein
MERGIRMDINDQKQELIKKVEKSLTYHGLSSEQTEKIEAIRNSFKDTSAAMISACNQSRELSIAITNLEQSLMWAVKSIALE